MTTKTTHRKTIGTFLIIGTLLALCFTIYEGYDMFRIHTTWLHRDGFMLKFAFIVIYADIALLFVAGLTSTISFFNKGLIWIPITKGIILNILLWLILIGLMSSILPIDFIFKICGLLIIVLCIWFLMWIWKMIRP